MEKKKISKNVNLDRQFFNINTRGTFNEKNNKKFNEIYSQKIILII